MPANLDFSRPEKKADRLIAAAKAAKLISYQWLITRIRAFLGFPADYLTVCLIAALP